MATDDVQLPDLAVIARYSLAVRAGTAPREEVIAALEEDLVWLKQRPAAGRPRKRAAEPSAQPSAQPSAGPPARRTPVRRARRNAAGGSDQHET
jgi:hypothetical protein